MSISTTLQGRPHAQEQWLIQYGLRDFCVLFGRIFLREKKEEEEEERKRERKKKKKRKKVGDR